MNMPKGGYSVMAQKNDRADFKEDFPTPPWAGRALCVHVLPQFLDRPLSDLTAWEPAVNRGYLRRPLCEFFGHVMASDVHDYGAGFEVLDFLMPIEPETRPDLVITNPPFRLASDFVRRAMAVSRLGCAVLVRGTWMETIERYTLFQEYPPTVVAQFAERVPMVKGRYDPKASTATSYAWVVFLHGLTDTRWRHIPPCRKNLEKPEDFPEVAKAPEIKIFTLEEARR
jgi:hypothetical protein